MNAPQPTAKPVQAVPPGEVYVSFSSEINPQTTEVLLGLCASYVNSKIPKVHLLISTLGGNVHCGMNAYNVLRAMPFHLTTYNVGCVNSIGNVLFLAGERRYCNPNATFMFHGVGFDVPQAVRFEEKLLRERMDALQADQKRIAAVLADRTKIDPKEIAELFLEAKTRDPDYAKARGIVDDVVELKIPAGSTVQQLVFQR